ncbi:MAG: hypothetical protein AMXMBFR58_20120 [Phycisphaerae bacterium]
MLLRTGAAACAAIVLVLMSGCGSPPRESSRNGAVAADERPGVRDQRARLLFEKLKNLAGTWEASSTKGWAGTITYETIAGGSCVMEVDGVAHPESKMISIYAWDIDRIVLTHYCAAKNHPRLVATEISDDASRAVFTFIDGTNLPSRDTGHMDSVVIQIKGPDEFTAQWSWYGAGKPDWMEEIRHTRVKTPG